MKAFKNIKYIAVSIGAFIILWQIISSFGAFNKALFPPPLKVWEAFVELWTQGLLASSSKQILIIHILASLKRFIIGYSWAVVIALSLGLFLGRHKKVFAYANPLIQIIRPIAPVAWLPFVVLLVGIGDIPAEIIIFIAGFFPILLSTVAAVNNVEPIYFKVASNFGISHFKTTFKIVLPAIFPQIMVALRLALSTCWIFLVSGEMVGAQSGLGFLIMDSKNALRTDALLATMFTIGIIGFGLDLLIRVIERKIAKGWGKGE